MDTLEQHAVLKSEKGAGAKRRERHRIEETNEEAIMAGQRRSTKGIVDNIRIKRAYEPRTENEGYRVLVDRLWPRGISKERLAPDAWIRELSPSDELRKWFGHDPSLWSEFQKRYRRELETDEARAALRELTKRAKEGPVTLLYAAKDELHNNAVVLRSLIAARLRRPTPARTTTPRERVEKRAATRGPSRVTKAPRARRRP